MLRLMKEMMTKMKMGARMKWKVKWWMKGEMLIWSGGHGYEQLDEYL